MSLNDKKILPIALCYVLLIALFLIAKENLSNRIIFPSQNLLSASATTAPKNIALTFDDGPYGTSTEKILDILKKEEVHATFFVIGKNVEKYPDLSRRIVMEGHLIENHSYDHSQNLPDMSTTTFLDNVQKAEHAILSTTGREPKLFRPPYGNITAQMYGKLDLDGYKTVLWNVDAGDWDYENSPIAFLEKTIVREAMPGGVILMHDGRDTKINYPRDNTIGALPFIIEKLKSQGYEFVTVDKIIGAKPYFDEIKIKPSL